MRTLFVHSGNMFGGVERVLAVVGGPDGAPIDPRFAVCFDGSIAATLRARGAQVHLLGPVRMTRPDLALAARRRLAAWLATERPDAVVMTSAWAHAIFAPVARRAGLPVVLWVHDVLSGDNWLERLSRRSTPDQVVCNSHVTERAARTVFPGAPTTVVYCPLTFDAPAKARDAVRHSLQVNPGTPVVISIGRMEPYKGQRVLLEALARLPGGVDWCWWCVGGPQRSDEAAYFAALQQQVRSAGLDDHVRFLGSRNDVADLLAAADVLCHPNSGVEPFGLVLVEALHAGLPVVASRLGGPEEIVTDACGALVPPGDAAALATALTALLSNDVRRRELGSAGPARAAALCDATARIRDLEQAIAKAIRLRSAA